MPFLPCFLCESDLEKRTDKNQKPYFVCYGCGIQVFVRGKTGVVKLEQLFAHVSERNFPFLRSSERFAQFRAFVNEVAALRTEIRKLDSQISFLFPESELVRTRDALQQRLNAALAELEELASAQSDKGKGK